MEQPLPLTGLTTSEKMNNNQRQGFTCTLLYRNHTHTHMTPKTKESTIISPISPANWTYNKAVIIAEDEHAGRCLSFPSSTCLKAP